VQTSLGQLTFDGRAAAASEKLDVHREEIPEETIPSDRSATMRASTSSSFSGVVSNSAVSTSNNRSPIVSVPMNCTRML
jgi:hypothetical protein